MNNLVLTVTRSCNLRCSYCPTAKDGWPSLSAADAARALSLFVELFGGGHVKIFGGEPLLVPDVVDAVLAHASRLPQVRRVYLSTNGLGLNRELLRRLRAESKLVLTISLDGAGANNRRLRRALPGTADAYEHLLSLGQELTTFPRLVVTQTFAPSAARNMQESFRHLLALGFRGFNFLPGYYLNWRPEQLTELRRGFSEISNEIVGQWRAGRRLYVRNLFTSAEAPFFNSGLVVDADRSIHASNVGLAAALDDTRAQTKLGDLDSPPTAETLRLHAACTRQLLAKRLPETIWQSTLAVDAELTAFCRGLYPEYAAYYRRRHAA